MSRLRLYSPAIILVTLAAGRLLLSFPPELTLTAAFALIYATRTQLEETIRRLRGRQR